MTGSAILILLGAAVIHATWNTVAKQAERAGGGGPVFVWLFVTCASVIYAPVVLYLYISSPERIDWVAVAAIAVSGVLHVGYYVMLQKGYRVGDLSLVYPVARGTAPLIATAGAVILLGERPSLIALVGALLVTFSIFLLSGSQGAKSDAGASRRAVRYGIVVAAFIASYTLWHKHAMSAWQMSPVVLDWGTNVILALFLFPYVAPRWSRVKAEWKLNGRKAIAVGVLCPFAYILVLYVLSFTPASYVAPAREVSILIGTLVGARLLREGGTRRRLVGALGMVVALALLTLG